MGPDRRSLSLAHGGAVVRLDKGHHLVGRVSQAGKPHLRDPTPMTRWTMDSPIAVSAYG